MRLGLSLDLHDLGYRLVEAALACPGRVHRLAPGVRARPHHAVAGIRIVRDRHRLDTLRALLVEKAPQVLGLVGVEAREGHFRHHRTAEDHVAVQVDLVGRAGPFIADQRGEAARLVMTLGGRDDLLPCRAVHLGQVQQLVEAAVVRGIVRDLHQRLEGIGRIGAGETASPADAATADSRDSGIRASNRGIPSGRSLPRNRADVSAAR